MDKDFTLIQTARPKDYASGRSESHPNAINIGHKDGDKGDPDRKATGICVGQLPESSAIMPGGRDT